MKLDKEIRNRRPRFRSASEKGIGNGSQIDKANNKARIGDIINSVVDEFNG